MKFPKIFSMVSLACFFAFFPFRSPASPARITEDFDANWLFSKGDFASAMMPVLDDSNWRKLNVPHDWSIEGPFSAEYGSGNGCVPGGVGWYRKHFQLDATQKNKLVAIVDSEERASEDGSAENAIDGQTANFWHPEWSAAQPNHPHQLVLDLGKSQTISGFRYVSRQSEGGGRIKDYRIYVGDNLVQK